MSHSRKIALFLAFLFPVLSFLWSGQETDIEELINMSEREYMIRDRWVNGITFVLLNLMRACPLFLILAISPETHANGNISKSQKVRRNINIGLLVLYPAYYYYILRDWPVDLPGIVLHMLPIVMVLLIILVNLIFYSVMFIARIVQRNAN